MGCIYSCSQKIKKEERIDKPLCFIDEKEAVDLINKLYIGDFNNFKKLVRSNISKEELSDSDLSNIFNKLNLKGEILSNLIIDSCTLIVSFNSQELFDDGDGEIFSVESSVLFYIQKDKEKLKIFKISFAG